MKYRVTMMRTSYGQCVIEVEADTKKQAEDTAHEEAGDYEYPEHGSDYAIDYTEEVSK